MSVKEQKFYGKVLLFGEYAVLKGADALTIPHKDYFGQFKFDRSKLNRMQSSHAKNLMSFAFYIKDILKNEKIDFDLERFLNELDKGLYFSSNIPMGHGLGSSGALSAALYNRYVKDISECEISEQLRSELALLEGFYHKKSSGMDPLLSFFGKPLYQKEGQIHFTEIPKFSDFKELRFFLIDTEQSRQTDKLVDLFHQMNENGEISERDFSELIQFNNESIQNFLQIKEMDLFHSFKELSKKQIKCLSAMIPLELATSWRNLLNEDHTYLKLCGAGGGGFMLGITRDSDTAEKYFKDYKLEFMD